MYFHSVGCDLSSYTHDFPIWVLSFFFLKSLARCLLILWIFFKEPTPNFIDLFFWVFFKQHPHSCSPSTLLSEVEVCLSPGSHPCSRASAAICFIPSTNMQPGFWGCRGVPGHPGYQQRLKGWGKVVFWESQVLERKPYLEMVVVGEYRGFSLRVSLTACPCLFYD